jgi:hypothetical protein
MARRAKIAKNPVDAILQAVTGLMEIGIKWFLTRSQQGVYKLTGKVGERIAAWAKKPKQQE